MLANRTASFIRTITYRYFDKIHSPSGRIACQQINPTLHEDDHDWRNAIAPKLATYSQLSTHAYRISEMLKGRKVVGIALGRKVHVSTVAAIFGCWIAGASFVPIDCYNSPGSYIELLSGLSKIDSILVSRVDSNETYKGALYTNVDILESEVFEQPIEHSSDHECSLQFPDEEIACILHTSGSSTGLPKCVPLTHMNLKAQMDDMIEAWKWSKEDRLMHLLPVNHIHGLVNCLLTPLYAGAQCLLATNMHPVNTWRYLKAPECDSVTVLMSVPTMFNQLVRECMDLRFNPNYKVHIAKGLRLVVCGSAPCPQITFDKWNRLTGHKLVERYGMTETGMILTNPIDPNRISAGTVGMPFSSISVRLRSEDGSILVEADGKGNCWTVNGGTPLIGSLEVFGPGVMKGYLGNSELNAFTDDGYFLTDDPEQWGQKVIAFIVPFDPSVDRTHLSTRSIREWLKEWLPRYELPSIVHIVDDLERNVMGKLQKSKLVQVHEKLWKV
ncbi:hypothetical protein ACOME3_003044 [Neoechinorhynchus agilis]